MKIEIIHDDITTLSVHAIVNAANSTLLGGGGVDGAIHEAAGPELLEECKLIRKEKLPKGLPVGNAVVTKAYNLPCEYVIHVNGPVFDPKKNQDNLLAYCFKNALDEAEKLKLKSIAFPAISTGAYRYPKRKCAEIAKDVFDHYRFNHIQNVIVCLFSKKDKDIFTEVFSQK